jgi:hypothetical protein
VPEIVVDELEIVDVYHDRRKRFLLGNAAQPVGYCFLKVAPVVDAGKIIRVQVTRLYIQIDNEKRERHSYPDCGVSVKEILYRYAGGLGQEIEQQRVEVIELEQPPFCTALLRQPKERA